jgi:hypothetical protein
MVALLVFLGVALSVLGGLPSGQKNSLVTLNEATSGDYWKRKWDLSTDPCVGKWFGITCDASNSTVVAINLSKNNLIGPLTDLQLPDLYQM